MSENWWLQMTEVRRYTWLEMEHLCDRLGEVITRERGRPDVIIAIARGGCFPGLLLSHYFHTRDLYVINVTTTVDDSVRATRTPPTVRSIVGLPDLRQRRVLLVDDVTNTGDTLRAAAAAVGALEPQELMTACPVWDTLGNEFTDKACAADFHGDAIEAWAGFPWERQ